MAMLRLSSICSSIALCLLVLESSVSLPLSQKPSLGYPVSRQECARQSQNALKCSDKEYHDIHCSCRPCDKTRQYCSQPHPDDEFCIRLARLSYCGDGTTTLPSTPTSTLVSTSVAVISVTDLVAEKNVALSATSRPIAIGYKLKYRRRNSTASTTIQTNTNVTLPALFGSLAAVFLFSCSGIVLLLICRKCPIELPGSVQQWRDICQREPKTERRSTNALLLSRPPPSQPPVSKGVTLTSQPSSPEEPILEATPPGIPPSGSDQLPISPEVAVNQPILQQQRGQRTRDQENARKKAAAASTSNATSF